MMNKKGDGLFLIELVLCWHCGKASVNECRFLYRDRVMGFAYSFLRV